MNTTLSPEQVSYLDMLLGLRPQAVIPMVAYRLFAQLRPQFKAAGIPVEAALVISGPSGCHKTTLAELIFCTSGEQQSFPFSSIRRKQLTHILEMTNPVLANDFGSAFDYEFKRQESVLDTMVRSMRSKEKGVIVVTRERYAPQSSSFSLRDRLIDLEMDFDEAMDTNSYSDNLGYLYANPEIWENIMVFFDKQVQTHQERVVGQLKDAFSDKKNSRFRIHWNSRVMIASFKVFLDLIEVNNGYKYATLLQKIMRGISVQHEKYLASLRRQSEVQDLVYEVGLIVDNFPKEEAAKEFPKKGEPHAVVHKKYKWYFPRFIFVELLHSHLGYQPKLRAIQNALLDTGILCVENTGLSSKRNKHSYIIIDSEALDCYMKKRKKMSQCENKSKMLIFTSQPLDQDDSYVFV